MNKRMKRIIVSTPQKPYFPKNKTQSLDFVLYKANSTYNRTVVTSDSVFIFV